MAILCATTETAQQIKKKTSASVMVLNNEVSVHKKVLLVDEFIMHHPGNILRVLSRDVEKVVLVGDVQ